MGARFCEYPEDLFDKMKGTIDPQDPWCYRSVQKQLKILGFKHLYKEIFVIIYTLGGQRPNIDNKVFDACVTDYLWLQSRFIQMKKYAGTKRKNMPSIYVILDLLLKRNGHTPFYHLPYLKDASLQARVLEIFHELDGNKLLEQS